MPDKLYHYCSNEAFVSTVTQKKIRLSLLTLSNDTNEGRHVRARLHQFIARRAKFKEKLFRDFDEVVGDLGAMGYCLSEKDDMLSQWRGYAANATGVAIGFDRALLDVVVVDQHQDCDDRLTYELSKVIYGAADQDELLEPIIASVVAFYKEGKGELLPDHPRFINEMADLMLRLHDFVPLLFVLKNPFFSEESEHRIICNISVTEASRELRQCEFRSNLDRIVPFKEFPKDELPPDVITEVVLGPRNNTPPAIVGALLRKHGFMKARVRRSSGTYR